MFCATINCKSKHFYDEWIITTNGPKKNYTFQKCKQQKIHMLLPTQTLCLEVWRERAVEGKERIVNDR